MVKSARAVDGQWISGRVIDNNGYGKDMDMKRPKRMTEEVRGSD